MSTFLLIVILFAFFLVFAFFSLAETAIFSTNRYKLRHLASAGNRRAARLSKWLDEPEALLATAIGLVAAIPAVVIYNIFARMIGSYKATLGDVAAQVLLLQSRDLDLNGGAAQPVRTAQKLRVG